MPSRDHVGDNSLVAEQLLMEKNFASSKTLEIN
jgi:hypothetical protein